MTNELINFKNIALSNDLLDSQVSAFSELKAAEREYTIAVMQNETERRELKQDRLERDLDFSIDATQKQIDLNDKLINNENATLKQRFKALRRNNSKIHR